MKNLPQKVGVTGGIGSGKTRVCSLFAHLGYRVFYADVEAKRLMVEDADLVQGIQELLGEEAYFENGQLNRTWVGQQVFNDPDKLQALNGLVHPATRRYFRLWYEDLGSEYKKAFMLYEAAILFESGGEKQVDGIISVYAPRQLRIERVMRRDQVGQDKVEARMNNQLPDAYKMSHSDFVIYNDGKHMLIPQVLAAIQFFQSKFESDL